MPGGAVRAESGEILLRTKGQAYNAEEYNDLVLRAWPNGMRLKLGDVANIIDGFAETDTSSRFDAYPTVLVQVFRVGDQTAIGISDEVKEYVAEIAPTLPEGLEITTWQDDSLILRDRMDVLTRNGRTGLLLVFLVLALFLKLRLALWVSVGIAVSFLGAFAVMPLMGITINLMSLFAFIMVLGIVVDDAIVVGENIYRHFEMGKSGLRAGIDGAREVGIPVTFSILTTLAAFYPLMNISGGPGQFLKQIPAIVIACLIFSLIESLFVLPNHLSHMEHHEDQRGALARGWDGFQGRFTGAMTWIIETFYEPLLDRVLRYRYVTLSAAVGLLLVSAGLIGGGWIKFVFFPEVEADAAVALLTMPQGTPAETTEAAIRDLEEAAFELKEQLENEGNEGVFSHMLASVGSQPFAEMSRQNGPGMGAATTVSSAAHLGELTIELSPSQNRTISSTEIARRWRELAPTIPDAVDLSFSASLISFGSPIDLQLQSLDIDELRTASAEIKKALRNYPGVSEVSDSYRAGKREIKLDIHPRAEALGLSLADVARQVRQGFYGAEAQRIQRGRDDIRVMVRYPAEERGTLASLEQMRVRTPTGAEVPFSFAGEAEFGRGFAAIQRTDRQRTMNVTADVDPAVTNANEVIADLAANVMPGIMARHPKVTYSLSGEQEFQSEALGDMMRAFLIALIMIFALLAIPFRSYVQPAIVMSAIPFGLIGALTGHLVLGMDLTMLSIFGIIALTGVVVNDSLVMVDFINRSYRGGTPLEQALREAGQARFRPIMLTSLTTFVGLSPLLLEKSIQAQFLIPMAVSLAFGVLFATGITLLLVPTLYRILEDLRPKRSRRPEPVGKSYAGSTA